MRNKQNKGVAKVMFDYWILVILWQTFRPVANRSLVDSLVKLGLFGMVLLYGVSHRDTRNTGRISVLFFLFLLTQMITIFSDSITTGSIITNVFMIIEIVVFVIWLHNEEISLDELEWFAGRIIFVAVVMSGYSILFRTGRFIRSFTSAGAYGSECKSFLYSNHEYALYLATALVFSIWMRFSKRTGGTKSTLLIAFLTINLITAFSRTAFFGCIIAIAFLSFAAGVKYFGRISFAGAAVLTVSLVNGKARNFVLGKILKGSYEKSGSIMDQGRSVMYQEEWRYFRKGSLMEKLFGHGYVGNQAGGHDAYLAILNTGGILMFLFFAILIIRCLMVTRTCMRIDRMTGALFVGLQIMVLMYMVTQTPIIFYSTMDSFFITVMFVMIPLYTTNFLLNQAWLNAGES